MNDRGQADERDVARLDAEIHALKASFESEIRRLDQVIALGEKGVNVALIAAEKAVNAALAAADKATEKAEKNTDDSFAKVNEFRGALDDLGRLMATRRELEDFKEAQATAIDTMRTQIVGIGTRLDTGAGAITGRQAGQTALRLTAGAVMAAITLGVLIITLAIYATRSTTKTLCYSAAHVQIACP